MSAKHALIGLRRMSLDILRVSLTVIIRVYHRYYGCDTGCCGHAIEVNGEESKWDFSHDYDNDPRKFAEDLISKHLGPEHVKDLDWENSVISDD
jgi:hypothetical protein